MKIFSFMFFNELFINVKISCVWIYATIIYAYITIFIFF